MKSTLKTFIRSLRLLATQEHGQDLVEYALVIALVAFGASAGMTGLAKGLNTAFSTISTTLSTDL